MLICVSGELDVKCFLLFYTDVGDALGDALGVVVVGASVGSNVG